MARKARQISAAGQYHVWLTSNEDIFTVPNDYDEFLKQALSCAGDTQICAYSLFPERVHMVLKSPGIPSEFMKSLTIRYVRYKNRTDSASGSLFVDRYRSEALETAEDFRLCREFVRHLPEIFHPQSFRSDKSPSSRLVKLYGEEYRSMPDELILEVLKLISGVNFSDPALLNRDTKKQLAEAARSAGRLSMRRVCRLLGLSSPSAASGAKKAAPAQKKKTAPKEKPAPKEEPAPLPKSSGNMSVWLL